MRGVSSAILSALSRTIGIDVDVSGTRVPHQLGQDVLELSRRFTRERERCPLSYMDNPQLRAAYLAYFFPVNLAKIQELLDELSPAFLWGHRNGVTRVLELGCGPGTGMMAVLDWAASEALLESSRLECVAVDQSQQALAVCRQLWDDYTAPFASQPCRLQLAHGDLQRDWTGVLRQVSGTAPYDLIIMENLLSELFVDRENRIERRASVVAAALELLSEKGTVMLIEPALRDASRDLHLVRDRLLATGACTVYSPCLHECPCPALINEDDWCHEERLWIPPAWVQAVDKEVGFIKDALKFSYALLRKDGRTVVERGPSLYRIVSELRVLKGEKRAWMCREGGRPEVGRLDRMASPTNAAVDDWHRGAIVSIDNIVRKQRNGKLSSVGRIERDTAVQIIRPV
ncbi:MAG TPA: small ribosomal subunit Rsm22 family protein [Nitrospiraceae bacterium]|nr:small ribosomal subunit Rsm22 family protein [Nitrospiraceae bacterium]